MGYIKVPYFDTRKDFWLGFIACTLLIILGYLLFKISAFGLKIRTNHKSNTEGKELIKQQIISIVIAGLILLLSMSCIYYFVRLRIAESKLIESNAALLNFADQASNDTQLDKVYIALGLVQKFDSVKSVHPESPLVNQLLSQIIALGNSLKIHKEWDPQRKTYQELSSARGLLLQVLCNAHLDSINFMKIKSCVSFAGADLRNTVFTNIDLTGIDLRSANFENSRLENCDISYSNLEHCSLIHCTIQSCKFIHASLKYSNIGWSKLTKTVFTSSYVDTVNLKASTLDSVIFKYATLIEANLSRSNLLYCDFSDAHLKGTDFTQSVLNYCKIFNATINRTHFANTKFNNTYVDTSWVNKYTQYLNSDSKTYGPVVKLVIDSTAYKDSITIRLISVD